MVSQGNACLLETDDNSNAAFFLRNNQGTG
jgi:hypothetical protein